MTSSRLWLGRVLTRRSGSKGSIRVERIDHIPDHAEAFDSLVKFYKQKRPPPDGKAKNGHHIDLTADSDDEGDALNAAEGGSQVQKELDDPVELASGLPCACCCACACLVAHGTAEEAVLALVDFPKQVVVALAVAVKYMKGQHLSDSYVSILIVRFWAGECFPASIFFRQGAFSMR